MPLQLIEHRLLFFLVTFVIVVACACSDAKPRPSVVEPGADAASDASAPVVDAGADAACSLPGSFGSSSCNACAASACCEKLAACDADADCKARVSCMLPCLDVPDAGGCAKACEETIPDERSLWYDLWGCVYFTAPCDFHCSSTR